MALRKNAQSLITAMLLCISSSAALAQSAPPLPQPRPYEPGVIIAGDWETVFDWTTDRCEDDTIPDLSTRAYIDADDQLNLLISHTSGHRMVGVDFDNLTIDCNAISNSTHNSDPAQFAESEWIAATYTKDGNEIFALVHNEYQGNAQLGDVCPSGEYFSCWYNTITLMKSQDGGKSFAHATAPPNHLVANFPQKYVPDGGVFGAFSPSNIIERDGYYYAFFKLQTYIVESQHTCLMRTADLSDPKSWRYWNGKEFAGVFANPYTQKELTQSSHTCTPIGPNTIAQLYEGISWNTYLQKYVLVGTSSDPTKQPDRYGFYYALSDDLINWDRRKLLLEVPLPWAAANPAETNFLYPTLIDHSSTSRNFETTGATAHLYFTRNNFGHSSLDRDLVRVPVRFVGGE